MAGRQDDAAVGATLADEVRSGGGRQQGALADDHLLGALVGAQVGNGSSRINGRRGAINGHERVERVQDAGAAEVGAALLEDPGDGVSKHLCQAVSHLSFSVA